MNFNLLERARSNRLSAVGSLATHKANNVFYIEEARQRRTERAAKLRFTTTRRETGTDALVLRRRVA